MITQKVLSNFLGYHSLVTLLKAYLNIVFDYPYYYNHFSTILNVVPFPSSDSFTKIFPLWYSSTIRFTSDRPSPQPRSLVVNPG